MSPVIVDSCSANLGKSVSTHSMLCPFACRHVDSRREELKHSQQQDEKGGHEDLARSGSRLAVFDEPVLPQQRPDERPRRTSLCQVLARGLHQLLLEGHWL
ncbi:hypothetical protein GQ600_6132 [Phytophthora cactorum]|nr:hypothetical protein GQ600_6132 [Phytophthora cactorum]